jgi:hypothetical protein
MVTLILVRSKRSITYFLVENPGTSTRLSDVLDITKHLPTQIPTPTKITLTISIIASNLLSSRRGSTNNSISNCTPPQRSREPRCCRLGTTRSMQETVVPIHTTSHYNCVLALTQVGLAASTDHSDSMLSAACSIRLHKINKITWSNGQFSDVGL